MADPEFFADAKQLNVDVNPLDGNAMDRILAELYATPKDVLEKAARAISR